MSTRISSAITCLTTLLLTACANYQHPDLPSPLRSPKTSVSVAVKGAKSAETGSGTRFYETPTAAPSSSPVGLRPAMELSYRDPKVPVTVSVENMPLPAFINEVFGNLLGLPFQIDPGLKSVTDLVTLRIPKPMLPAELFPAAQQVLDTYGVSILREGEILRFVPASAAPASQPPLLISGRALPSVPVSHRPVFQIMPLHAAQPSQMAMWLRDVFAGNPKLQVKEDMARGVVMLSGPDSVVREAMAMVLQLDQPTMRGRFSTRVEPLYWGAEEMAGKVMEVLKVEGYNVSTDPGVGSIVLLPLKANNSLLVFAPDAALLRHAKEWIQQLDVPGRQRDQDGVFTYAVQNTSADGLVDVLTGIGGAGAGGKKDANQATTAGGAAGGQTGATSSGQAFGRGRLVVDEARNTVLFFGKTEEWMNLLPVLKQMDRPDRMALIEVTIAEISLTDKEEFGINWLISGHEGLTGSAGAIGTLVGDITRSAGLTYSFDNAGQTKAVLNALAKNTKLRVLSTPRLMVKSGQEASIQVGTRIPVVTSQVQGEGTPTVPGGASGILQQISYLDTGVLLNINPVIFAGNQINLSISQTVSSSQDADANVKTTTPRIDNRSINTSVTLHDGGSVLLGGLIRTTTNLSNSKVPLLGDLPLVGKLFREDEDSQDRTELMILVVPYIIDNEQEAGAVTESYRQRLNLQDQPSSD